MEGGGVAASAVAISLPSLLLDVFEKVELRGFGYQLWYLSKDILEVGAGHMCIKVGLALPQFIEVKHSRLV